MNPRVSIVICTRNRADSLRETLASIGQCDIAADLPTELIVVDNGSTDHTAQVVAEAKLTNMPVRYTREPVTGQSGTRNRGVIEAKGDILLCTDDDIRAPANWIDDMCRPIVDGRADGTVGARVVPPHLHRSWMEPVHYDCLACNMGRRESDLVGANMAFARYVLARAPLFDTEIGLPFTAGGEDTLFSRQVVQAGFSILQVPSAVVAHHFHPDRLKRSKMREAALKGAIGDFYIEYHWMYQDIPNPWYRLGRALLRLWYYRVRHCWQWWTHESMPAWEKGMIQEVRKIWLFIRHRGEPRRYERFGLKKISFEADATAHVALEHQRAGEVG